MFIIIVTINTFSCNPKKNQWPKDKQCQQNTTQKTED